MKRALLLLAVLALGVGAGLVLGRRGVLATIAGREREWAAERDRLVGYAERVDGELAESRRLLDASGEQAGRLAVQLDGALRDARASREAAESAQREADALARALGRVGDIATGLGGDLGAIAGDVAGAHGEVRQTLASILRLQGRSGAADSGS